MLKAKQSRPNQKTSGLWDHFLHLVKFGTVGASGTVLNLIVFWLLVDYYGFNANGGSIAGFMLAVSSNYYWNRRWTFRAGPGKLGEVVAGYVRYVGVNALGLLVNLAVLNAVLWLFAPKLALFAQAAGIAAAMLFNFTLSKLFVFG